MPAAPYHHRLLACFALILFVCAVLVQDRAQAQERSGAGALPLVAVAAELAGDEARTALVFTLSAPVTPEAFVMEGPDRIIVDLPEVNFQVPAETRTRLGLVTSFRYGLFAPGRSRIVIDLDRPALVSRLDVTTRPVDEAVLLTVELTRAERPAFERAARADAARVLAASVTRAGGAAPAAAGDGRPTIVIDPGHGGVDPGATTSAGLFEKDIVFAFAERLRDRLNEGGRYRIVMTRDEDVFVPLGERVRIARQVRADLFISIHADSISSAPQVRGLTVYTGSERASDKESATLADRENRADATAGVESGDTPDDVADILRELTSRETRTFSHRFATKLVDRLDGVARLNKNSHRQAGFVVLRAHDVPSVLVELGYLSSKQDIDLLMSDAWRNRASAAMAEAIGRYFSTRLANQGSAPVSP